MISIGFACRAEQLSTKRVIVNSSVSCLLRVGVDMLNVKWHFNILVHEIHLSSESGSRPPCSRVSWVGLLQHFVDLLEGQTLSLRNQEVDEAQRHAAKTAPHEEDVRAEIGIALARADQVRCDGGDDAVPEPVR